MSSLLRRLIGFSLIAFSTASAVVTITGNVVDETGNPVPGAVVSAIPLAQSSAGTVVSAASDATGMFRLAIPDTATYQLRVQCEGFFLLVNNGGVPDPARPLEVHLNHLRALAESVDVSYSPVMVHNEETSEVKDLDGQTILNLPYAASQDYRQAFQLMPGAILDTGGQAHFNGGNVSDVSYRLDGFDVADTATGALNARVSVDTVQTVEWSSDRMTAVDKGSSGTIDIGTEMGDDQWRYGATNPIPSFDTSGGFHLSHWAPRFMMSGPIAKRKVWFHLAFDPFYLSDTIASLPKGENRTSSFTGSDINRFQWNVSARQTLTANFLYNRGNIWNENLSVLSPIETTVNQRASLLMGSAKDQLIVGDNLIEVGAADTENYVRTSPLGSDPYLITPFGSSGNFFRDQALRSSRREGILNVAFRPLHHGGTHQIRVGADIEGSTLKQIVDRHEESIVGANGALVRTISFQGSPLQSATDLEAYGYASDHWIVGPTLAFDIGVRTQWNRVTGANAPAPRLGAAWAPQKLGGAKFSAGWGVYYEPPTLALLALGEEQTSLTTFYAGNGLPVGAPIESKYVVNADNLRSPRFTLRSLSAEKVLPAGFVGRIDLISRRSNDDFTFAQFLLAPTLNAYVADNSRQATYRAAELTLRRTFRKRYQWFGAYTRSATRSNAVIAYSVENPLFTPQGGGPQPWDAPSRILVGGWLPLPFGRLPRLFRPAVDNTDIQLFCDYHTGLPFTATTENGYLYGAPDSRRFPTYLSLNVAAERRFHFRGYLWALRLGMVNVLNRANPNEVNSDADSPQFLTFERGQARAANIRLRFLGKTLR